MSGSTILGFLIIPYSWIFESFILLITQIIFTILKLLVGITIVLCIGHSFGWIERIIWYLGEKEAMKLANGTKVTAGSFVLYDFWNLLLHGKVQLRVSNIIFHTPQRNIWYWDSPLIARIGSLLVECNVPITLFHLVFFRNPHVPIELYTVVVTDVQVFLERRQHVFNVYLMDPSIILPNPNDIMKHLYHHHHDQNSRQNQQQQQQQQQHSYKKSLSLPLQTNDSQDSEQNTDDPNTNNKKYNRANSIDSINEYNNNNEEEQSIAQAKRLVHEMFKAVKSLGTAAQRGSLQGALQQQGQHLADTLRQKRKQLSSLQQQQQQQNDHNSTGMDNNNNDASISDFGFMSNNGIISGKETLEQSVRVMQHVGKVAVESLASAKTLEQLVPERKSSNKPKPTGRVGRIVLRDLRIFTRDTWINTTTAEKDKVTKEQDNNDNSNDDDDEYFSTVDNDNDNDTSWIGSSDGGWNRPITLQEVIIRAAELCPPMSLVDDDDLPAIYQPIDKVAEVVWKRVLAEMAKSNTGRFFQTAMSEVLGYMKTQTTAASTTISSSSSTTNLMNLGTTTTTGNGTTTNTTTSSSSKRRK